MPRDVRRSDQTEVTLRAGAEPAPAQKASDGFARSLFRLGAKRTDKRLAAAEQSRLQERLLQERLKEVLERDRALADSQPEEEVIELEPHEVELHEDDVWPDPFETLDLEPPTGTRAAPPHEPEGEPPHAMELWEQEAAHEPPFAPPPVSGTRPMARTLQETDTLEPADLRLSQIASWIEAEIDDDPADAGRLALDLDEAAELDAVLAAPELAQVDPTVAEPVADMTFVSEGAPLPSAAASPGEVAEAQLATDSGAQASALPAPDDEEAPEAREPINTRTMARLLAMQGYKPRAMTIYRELLKRTPEDPVLRAELEALQQPD